MKHYVEFYFSGVSCVGSNEREVSVRDSELVTNVPTNAISYRFFNKDENENNVNYSPYYFLGTEYSVKEFKEKYPQLASSNWLTENVTRVVKAVTGGFYPLSENDVVVNI